MPGQKTAKIKTKNEKQIKANYPADWYDNVWAYIDEHNKLSGNVDNMTMRTLVYHAINEYIHSHPNEMVVSDVPAFRSHSGNFIKEH